MIHPSKEPYQKALKKSIRENIGAVVALIAVIVVGLLNVGVRDTDAAAAACVARGGHVGGSYVDQIRCLP